MKTAILLVVFAFCATQTSACPRGWKRFRANCFAYGRSPSTYAEANLRCQILGGFLAQPLTHVENKVVAKVARWRPAYIGANDIRREGRWVMTDDGENLGFSHWYPREPNNVGGKEDCAQTNFRKHGAWNDLPCNLKLPYVCQRVAYY